MFTWIKTEVKKFFHSERSAVTVLVTFLLVPAILVTGTGVEFARIFANRTVTENAAELAANAALTQYDSILKDMYGLYAIAMTDGDLSELLNAYVKAAFEEGNSTLLLNSGDATAALNTTDSNYYLSNKEILARQIQEYCKIRGIGALANDLIDKFNIFDFSKLKVDLDIFDKKLETDDQFKALLEQYGDFYFRMRYNDYFVESSTGGIIGKLNDKKQEGRDLTASISSIVAEMQSYKEQYDDAPNHYVDDELAEFRSECSDNFEKQKDSLLELIDSFTNDFPSFTHSSPNSEHKAGASRKPWYVNIVAEITGYNALEALFQQPGSNIEYYRDKYDSPDCLVSYSYNLDQIIGSANAINRQIDDFKSKQTELNNAISNGSDITKPTMTNQSEVYDRYMNKIDVSGVVSSIVNSNKEYITNYQSYFNDDMFSYSGSNLGYTGLRAKVNSLNLSSSIDSFNNTKAISFLEFNSTNEWGVFCKHTSDGLSGNPFTSANLPKGLRDLYWILALQYVNTDADAAKTKVKSALNNIGKAITGLTDELLKGLQPYPLGNDIIPSNLVLPSQGIGAVDATGSFALQLDEMGESNKQTRSVLKDLKKTIELFSTSAIGNATDKVLTTVYATHMFSNYATAKKDSMAGYKFNTQLNYLQGAEQEYIIIGNREGIKNLAAFGAVIVSIRTVLNFASTFVIPEINALVNSVAAAAAAVPFVGPALFLLVQGGMRLAIAAGESLVDLYLLRKGKTVPFFKFISKDFVVGNPVGFAEFTRKLTAEVAGKVKNSAVNLTKDLVKVAFSTGEMEINLEATPNETSAKLLDEAAKRKFDNSNDISDFANLGIDAGLAVYDEYSKGLERFVNGKIEVQAALYLQEEADRRGLSDVARQEFINGYKNYVENENPAEAYYTDIKNYLDRDAILIANDVEWARNNPGYTNDYYEEFKSIPTNQRLLDSLTGAATKAIDDRFGQFTPSGMIKNIKDKFSLSNLLGVDYSFYTGVWILLTVNRDDLILRIADLISLNVANKSSKLTPLVGDLNNFAAFGYGMGYAATYNDAFANGKLPPMTQEIFNKYTLDKRRVFIQADVTYEMKWTFISLGFFQSDPMDTGRIFPTTFPIRTSVYRGY